MAGEGGGGPQRRQVPYRLWVDLSIHGVFSLATSPEKYLKALLTRRQVEFPKTHDIDELLDLIAPIHGSLSESLRDVTVLTNYGVDVRYPGDLPSVTISDAQQAVRLAERVRQSVLELL